MIAVPTMATRAKSTMLVPTPRAAFSFSPAPMHRATNTVTPMVSPTTNMVAVLNSWLPEATPD